MIIAGLFIVYVPNIISNWGHISSNIAASRESSFTANAFGLALKSAFIYGTFQLTNIAALIQHSESFENADDSKLCNVFGWIINSLMMVMCALGLFAVVDMEGINKVSIPVLEMVKSGVGSSFMAPLISTLIILGAVSTGVNMIASMTKRIQGAIEAPEVVERSIQTGKPTKVAIIATLVCCIVDFCVAQFGLISLVSKGYSFIAYLTIPVITIPYIIHMIATNFDRKNPPRVTPEA
jgi:uncharacterized membrane protein YkvI